MTQLVLNLARRPALGVADFFVNPRNQDAVAWIDRWPGWPSPALALHGPPGSGKTHLAYVWRTRSSAPIVPGAMLDEAALPDLLGDGSCVAVDEAERAPERALLHLYNMVAERRGHLLLVAGSPPSRWGVALADLRSRLLACPAVAIEPPDDDLIAAVLMKLFADRQVIVGLDVIFYLLRHMERSFDAARRIAAELDAAALAEHRPITVALARRVLAVANGGGDGESSEGGDAQSSSPPSDGASSPGVV
jgi:chromosomal replication initiation ATPase DnaA